MIRTAQEHADFLRAVITDWTRDHRQYPVAPAVAEAALDALIAEVEQLTQKLGALDRVAGETVAALTARAKAAERERDEARALYLRQIETLTDRLENAIIAADAAELECDELLIERGEWDSWKNHAEACERERNRAQADLAARNLGYGELEREVFVLKIRAEAAEALAERRGAAATLASSELDWCIGYAATAEHEAWRERLLKRLHVARAALARLSAGKETSDE